jgi:myo-inositol-1(or 4)-monophosphatase
MTRPATALDLQHARLVAIDAAESAGRLLRDGARAAVHVEQKSASGDVVSNLDTAAETLIVGQLRAAFPGHGVIAEEGGIHQAAEGRFTWLVDPLDGTNNLAIGLESYVVGIALCDRGRPVVGIVHDPVAGQTWSAVRGHGLRCDGGPAPKVHGAKAEGTPPVVAWTQGHGVSRSDSTARAVRFVLDSKARRVLQLWAPLVAWIMLARGDIDGIVGYRPEGIDLPAGALIAQEAGMVLRAFDGGTFNDRIDASADERSFVAGPPETIDRLVKLVAAAQWIEPELHRLIAGDLAATPW